MCRIAGSALENRVSHALLQLLLLAVQARLRRDGLTDARQKRSVRRADCEWLCGLMPSQAERTAEI